MKFDLKKMPLIWKLVILIVAVLLTIFFVAPMIMIFMLLIIGLIVNLLIKRVRQEKQIIEKRRTVGRLKNELISKENSWAELKEASVIQAQEFFPEIKEQTEDIFQDEEKIQVLLEESSLSKNKEYQQIQQLGFQRFIVIFNSCIKMKRVPDDFEDVQRRLCEGREKISTYAQNLRQLVRDFNEEDMRDFEVALKQMEGGSNGQ
ncbi:hypothetical protein [Lactococcus termiticola]|uniref:5-bromo-4-chloroindolyl phosphate hydrolase n=1 Tax=Lactococcus termiticola TaxID=2169526 RepID=A0A2R5HKD2_9LACT|nr:hypothetical protein [Lactococcus termiticola]GBG97280.1 hypothetical protein NtB2_01419 [Lactococcus termiticola]